MAWLRDDTARAARQGMLAGDVTLQLCVYLEQYGGLGRSWEGFVRIKSVAPDSLAACLRAGSAWPVKKTFCWILLPGKMGFGVQRGQVTDH